MFLGGVFVYFFRFQDRKPELAKCLRSHFDAIFSGLMVNWEEVGCCIYDINLTQFHSQGVVKAVIDEACNVALNIVDVHDHAYADDLWLFSKSRHLRVSSDSSQTARDAAVLFLNAVVGYYLRTFNVLNWDKCLTATRKKGCTETSLSILCCLYCIRVRDLLI